MSVFSRATFDAAAYAASRPTYPRALLDHVVSFLDRAPPRPNAAAPPTLLDLGCGPGLSTFDWLGLQGPRFPRIIGIDPSSGMVHTARDILAERVRAGQVPEGVDMRFEVARGDQLGGIVGDSSVDLAIAGQAAHWFDAPATYKELARILKPGGAFAFWGYGEFFFPGRPDLSALIPPYSAGTLGPYWEQPGRSIVEALLIPFPLPSPGAGVPESIASQFDPASLTRSFFLRSDSDATGPSVLQSSGLLPREVAARLDPPLPTDPGATVTYTFSSPEVPAQSSAAGAKVDLSSLGGLAHLQVQRSVLLTKRWDLAQLEGYLRTWSAAHAYDEAHPERQAEGKDGGGDVVGHFVEQLRARGLGSGREGKGWGNTFEVGWEMGIVMGRKRHE